jgi:hypothetical protein
MQEYIGAAGIVCDETEAPVSIPHFQGSGRHLISPSPSTPMN